MDVKDGADDEVIKLTAKREAWCVSYVELGDKSAAYRLHYSTEGMTAKSINEEACKLSQIPNVAQRVEQLKAKVRIIAEQKFSITHESILKQLDILRKARIDEFVNVFTESINTGEQDKNGDYIMRDELRVSFKPFSELSDEQLMCIESVKQDRFGCIELKLHGKDWTIEKINKHIGFYEKDNSQKKPEISLVPSVEIINPNE